jgi:outer membrane receptor protein involved in Fe transport
MVERIEIVRGPSSALYGSNGIFATINVVTRSPVQARTMRVGVETGSYGEKKVTLSSGASLGHGANLLVSASVFNNGGQSLYFPEFDRRATNFGRAVGVDGERGYHLFAELIWHNWAFTGYLGSREKQVPTGWYNTIFNDRGNKILDQRGFFEAAYSHDLYPRVRCAGAFTTTSTVTAGGTITASGTRSRITGIWGPAIGWDPNWPMTSPYRT